MKEDAVLTKAPQGCAASELADFASLVLTGGEVQSAGLGQRIAGAHALCFLRRGEFLIGIAATKKPNHMYRASVFKKANATLRPSLFPIELGWVFVLPGHRGKHLSHKLVAAAIESVTRERIFATSRTDNLPMHALLTKAAFVPHGKDFASARGSHRLSLFLLTP